MVISSVSTSFDLITQTGKLREQYANLQLQLSSGRKATTYAGLGLDRSLAISLRARVSSINSYVSTIDKTEVRVNILQEHLSRLNDIASDTKSSAFGNQFELIENGQTQLQLTSRSNLDEVVSLLNFELSGTHYFSGKTTDTSPVAPADQILNGIGTQAGFKQILTERNSADLGASGLGRVTIANASTTSVQLSEDGAHPFGFKLSAATSSLTGVTVTGPTGAPASVDVAFSTTLPQAGEAIKFTLDLPDGTTTDLVLTAVSGTAGDGEFTIGATDAATRANFQTALSASITQLSQTDLQAASSAQASENFFNFDAANPPQRVDGPPFDSATALVDGTTNDTVFWYKGDLSADSARSSAVVQIDKAISFSYGARADEGALRTLVQNLSLLAAESFDATDPNAQERYNEVRSRVSSDLAYSPPNQSILQMISEFGQKQGVLGQVGERHEATRNTSGDILGEIENADSFEVSAQILQLQTRLEASYEISARLSQLSLLQFL